MGFPEVKTALVYVAGIAGSVTTIFMCFENGRKFLGGIWHGLLRMIPTKTNYRVELKIVPDHGACQWQEGSGDFGKEAMLVHCKLFLTNVAPIRPYQILGTYIKKPHTRGYIHPRLREAEIPMIPQLGDARLANEFTARFTISPPVCKSKSEFTCDIVLVDQFNGKHVAKRVKFEPVGGAAWEAMRKQRESDRQLKVLGEAVDKLIKQTKDKA
jgi:hypothetical protein